VSPDEIDRSCFAAHPEACFCYITSGDGVVSVRWVKAFGVIDSVPPSRGI
jgi:hypothetical protein